MNYWQLLISAEQDLADGALRSAENGYHAALAAREADGRRVFFTESVPDGLGKMWRRLRRQDDGEQPGRWDARLAGFRRRFVATAAGVTAEAQTLLDLGAGDDPRTAATVMEEALFLAVDTRLARGELAATDLLPALLQLAPAAGRLPDLDLVPETADLPPALRLALAQIAVDRFDPLPQEARRPWAERLLLILDDEPSRPWSADDEARRSWLAASLADRDLEVPGELVARWAHCDREGQLPARCHWSRLRRLELLSGCDPRRPDITDPTAARRLAVGLPRDGGDELAVRLQAALDIIDYRAPRAELDEVWLSGAVDAAGLVRLVSWWGDCPRDVLCWRPGDATTDLRARMRAAGDRVVWAGGDAPSVLREAWADLVPGRAVVPLLETLLEPDLPPAGWSDSLARGLALGRSGPWRQDWRPDLGLPLLSPPGQDGQLHDDQADHAGALEAGLLWLAVRHRLDTGDPALRAGLREMGRRGHYAAAFVHRLAVLGAPDKASVDAGFEAWTLPLLWTRPDPLADLADDDVGFLDRPELRGQEVAVVAGGAPSAVLRAWGDGEQRWRLVLDRAHRLPRLSRLARESYGPVTLVPPQGRVHQLGAALERLDRFIAEDREDDDLLALCHWVRLVETHNGDLLDFVALRPRAASDGALYQRYAEAVADLPSEEPRAEGSGWGAQYAQRVRRSGLVAGLVADLPVRPELLDPLWGVFDGSEASWVFMDSAAVHWRLGEGRPEAHDELHRLLASRGRRHLSLLSGQGLFPRDLAHWFDQVLAPYGRPYHADLSDGGAPRLRLAGTMPLPGGHLRPEGHAAAALAHLQTADGETCVLMPRNERDARFWRDMAAGGLGPVGWRLATNTLQLQARRLVVPRLVSLDGEAAATTTGEQPTDWQHADRARCAQRDDERRRTALELAALQAVDVGLLDVLDARWWRWLLPAAADADSALGLESTAAAEILEPGPSATPTLVDGVRRWLVDAGCVAGLVPGWTGGALAEAATIELAGRHLHVGGGEGLWTDLAAACLAAWEGGATAPRLLVVAETPPPGMAALVAAMGAARSSVLAPGDQEPCGNLIWARPDGLLDTLGARRELAGFDAVLLLDLDQLLPGGGDHALTGAGILGWLGQGVAGRVDLVGGPLSPAWVDFLGHQLGGAVDAPDTGPGGWKVLRRGAVPRTDRHCPVCGHQGPAAADGMACSGCGLDLCRVETPADPVAAAVARGRSLLAQADLGRDRPLEIWGDAEALAAVRREALSAGAEPAPSDPLFLTLPDQRQWRLCPLEGRCRAEAGPAVLLHPPTDVGRLLPLAPRHDESELILLYDEADLRRLAGESSHEGVARLLAVLTDSAALAAEAPGHDQPGRPTLTSWGLAWLTALPEPEIRRQLGDLTWAARLGESFDAPLASAHGAGRLRLHVSRRDLELQLGGLSAHMRAVLAASHGGIPAGVPSRVIWPDCQGSAGLLDRQLDRFLALAASPDWCAALGVAPAVIHEAPGGAWFSAVRRVGRLVEPEVLIAGLADTLDHVATWSDTLLAESSRVDTGIDVPLSLPVTPRDRALLVLGQELGFWCLGMELGDELVALAEVTDLLAPAVKADDAPCRQLLLDQAAAADVWRRRLERTPAGGVLVTEPEWMPAEESRRWWRRGSGDPLAELRREITQLADDPRHRRLVLDGPVGTGRVPALLSGLAGSRRGRRAEIWCPDHATMAWVQRTARRIDATWSLDLRLGAVDQDVGVVANRAPAEQRPVVLVEAQRFPRQVCYKLQDAGREPGLIITVDPWEIGADTSWEDLFITTPREADVRRLRTQLAQARLPWEVTRNLVADVQADARSFRRERGQVKVRRAGTIDECAAAVTVAHEADKLGPEVLVLAPHAEDVDLLGRALGDRLWAAGRADAVAPLLAPGLLETVAALADAHRQQHGHWPGGPGSLAAAEPLLSELLPAGEARGWHTWLRSLPTAGLETADAFLLRWRRSPWGRSQAPTQLAQDQVATWCEAGGVEPMACLPREIWLCWRRILADALGRPDLAPAGPVALLATADAAPAGGAESLVYVCFGSEPATVHRRCLSQATDRALVLYQERSPLPGDHDETG